MDEITEAAQIDFILQKILPNKTGAYIYLCEMGNVRIRESVFNTMVVYGLLKKECTGMLVEPYIITEKGIDVSTIGWVLYQEQQKKKAEEESEANKKIRDLKIENMEYAQTIRTRDETIADLTKKNLELDVKDRTSKKRLAKYSIAFTIIGGILSHARDIAEFAPKILKHMQYAIQKLN
jgi:hypothetical protein